MAPFNICVFLLGLVVASQYSDEQSSKREQVLLNSDDECDGETGQCALSALQRQRVLQQVEVAAEAEDEEAAACHDMAETERGACWNEINWARNDGLSAHPDWYPGLSKSSHITEWQMQVYNSSHPKCPRPCSLPPLSKWCKSKPAPTLWKPADEGSATPVKILSYNLFWWHLFGIQNGAGNSAGKLIGANMHPDPFDVMGFQECEDPVRVLGPVGLLETYTAFQGKHAVCIAYRTAAWNLIDHGLEDVAEDYPYEYYGKRGVMWMRLQHKVTKRYLFFANHHGPLSVNSGGLCGGADVANNLLTVMGTKAQVGDILVLVGDFNANAASRTIQGLWPALTQVYNGESFGGVDNIFSNVEMTQVIHTKELGSGGSDHQAISAELRVGAMPLEGSAMAAAMTTQSTTTTPEPCSAAVEGDKCWPEVQWARTTGIKAHPDWYPGLSASSSTEEFQAMVYKSASDKCPRPCSVPAKKQVPETPETPWEEATPIKKVEPQFSVDVLDDAALGADTCLLEPGVKYELAEGWYGHRPGVADPRICCNICNNLPDHCNAWTWTEWKQSAKGPMCTLYGGAVINRKSDMDGWVSGLPKPQAEKEAERVSKLQKNAK